MNTYRVDFLSKQDATSSSYLYVEAESKEAAREEWFKQYKGSWGMIIGVYRVR